MEHKLTVTLPDEIYQPLVEAATQQGRTPEGFAAERLARAVPPARRLIQPQHKRRTGD